MKSQCDRRAIFRAQPTVRAENQDLCAEKLVSSPTHADVEAKSKHISRRLVDQHVRRNRQLASRAGRMSRKVVENAVRVLQD